MNKDIITISEPSTKCYATGGHVCPVSVRPIHTGARPRPDDTKIQFTKVKAGCIFKANPNKFLFSEVSGPNDFYFCGLMGHPNKI